MKVSIVTVLLEFEFHLNFPHDIATLLIQILLSLTAIIVLILPPLQTFWKTRVCHSLEAESTIL